jgi:hypothetical protein
MSFYDVQANLLHLRLLFFTWFFYNNKRKTYSSGHIQKSCTVLLLQQSSSQRVCVGPTCKGQAITAPPPSPWSPCPYLRGPKRPGRGQGCCWSPPDSYSPARISHGSYPWGYVKAPITIGEHPCKRAGAGDNILGGDRGGWGVGEGGENQREEAYMGEAGEGGKGVGKHMCKWSLLAYILYKKKLWDRYTWNLHTYSIFLAVAIIITLMIHSSLKDWQSMKKNWILGQHNRR